MIVFYPFFSPSAFEGAFFFELWQGEVCGTWMYNSTRASPPHSAAIQWRMHHGKRQWHERTVLFSSHIQKIIAK
jgi:hypothetical protein